MYASLYYFAFVRNFDDNSNVNCEAEKCMVDLRSQVATIFISQIVVSNVIELGSVYASRIASGGGLKIGFTNDGPLKDRIQMEWKSEKYERTDYFFLFLHHYLTFNLLQISKKVVHIA